MPPLCNPYTAGLSNRTCATGEVSLSNASQVWRGYICQAAVVSGSEICTTTGRVTPGIYKQMAAAVNHSKWIYVGLVMVSTAVMLSLIFWVIYARERRHRKYNKQFIHSGSS